MSKNLQKLPHTWHTSYMFTYRWLLQTRSNPLFPLLGLIYCQCPRQALGNRTDGCISCQHSVPMWRQLTTKKRSWECGTDVNLWNSSATNNETRDLYVWQCCLWQFTIGFYPRDAMLARVFAIATCPSVRPSVRPPHAGIVPSRAKAGSWNVHHLIAPSL